MEITVEVNLKSFILIPFTFVHCKLGGFMFEQEASLLRST